MLTKDQTNTLISIIDKMEESPLKTEVLHQLNDLIKRDEENRIQLNPINMKDIYKGFKTPTEQVTIKRSTK